MMYHSVPVESKPVTPVTHTDWQSQPLCSYNTPSRHVGHKASVFSWVSPFLSLSNTFHQISSGEPLPSGFFKTWVLSGESSPRFFLCVCWMEPLWWRDASSVAARWRIALITSRLLFCSRWYWFFFIRKIKTGQPVLTGCQCCPLHPVLPTCRIWDTRFRPHGLYLSDMFPRNSATGWLCQRYAISYLT